MKRKKLAALALSILLFLTACGTEPEPRSISFSQKDFATVTQIVLRNAHNGRDTVIGDASDVHSGSNGFFVQLR